MQHIIVQYATDKKLAPAKKLICHWAEQALATQDCKQEVTIRIVDIAEMTALNQDFRGKSGATNVLSFPADLPDAAKEAYPVLGDIVICADVVNREAAEQGKSEPSHWAHMVTHGVLHLLGHDHVNDDEAEIMESLEIKLMQQLGFSNPYNNGEMIKDHE